MGVGDDATETDLLVIGSGPGGYVAAIRGAQLGLDTTLVEKDAYGGACLNRGCIPSKAFIHAADVAHEAATAEELGVHADPTVDMQRMQEWKSGVVHQLTRGVEKLSKANGVSLIEGTAKFADAHTARVVRNGERAETETVEFDNAILATGSQPVQIPGFDFGDDPVLSSSQLLQLESVPDRLVVVGAGYIGMELSTMLAKLGTDVTVVEMLDDVLPTYEADVKRIVRKRAEALGIDFHFGEGATDWEETADGVTVSTETEAGDVSRYEGDAVLVAVGRQPVTDTVNLDAVGVTPDTDGFVQTDDHARTDAEHVFAVGDVAGEPMLAHKASAEGVVAAAVAAGESATLDQQAIPAAVFTDPEIATVGLTEAEAAEAGFDPVVGEMPLRASGRALTMGESDGFVRIVAAADSETVLGGQLVGPNASEVVAEVALAVEMSATLEDVAETVHTHPTLTEAVMEAAENARGQAVHTLNR
ncbi:dihydrolipoyl dehydrogenase [Halobellus sp. Atlit-31R]|nr:dihydrolipoyl dehydrogenase [Halobellus sp. Atlit-31R]